jgi:hypothetical protein
MMTFKNTFVIIDRCQNRSIFNLKQIVMSRMVYIMSCASNDQAKESLLINP